MLGVESDSLFLYVNFMLSLGRRSDFSTSHATLGTGVLLVSQRQTRPDGA